jgi:hypothetical protein
MDFPCGSGLIHVRSRCIVAKYGRRNWRPFRRRRWTKCIAQAVEALERRRQVGMGDVVGGLLSVLSGWR